MWGTIKSLKFKTTKADIVFLHSSNLLTIFLTNGTVQSLAVMIGYILSS